MPLTVGARVGRYEILGPLGAGGMGEVYRARDARLSREIALKILPAEVVADESRRRRFELEARSAGALNHPNLLALFDIGDDNGTPYLISELIEGESLRALIQRGPVPVRRLVEIATEIADGLQAAHEAQIVHRDIKPDNVLMTRDGRAKIVDFGLARYAEPATAPSVDEPTRTMRVVTGEGTVLGTVSYMSPEQARGERVDFRSDQFSFGILLHEMATGKRPFDRPASVETLAAIIRDEPPALGPEIPDSLRWIVERCLAKEPRDRYGSTRDLFHELRRLRDQPSRDRGDLGGLPQARRRFGAPALAGAALGCALLGAVAAQFFAAETATPAYRYDLRRTSAAW